MPRSQPTCSCKQTMHLLFRVTVHSVAGFELWKNSWGWFLWRLESVQNYSNRICAVGQHNLPPEEIIWQCVERSEKTAAGSTPTPCSHLPAVQALLSFCISTKHHCRGVYCTRWAKKWHSFRIWLSFLVTCIIFAIFALVFTRDSRNCYSAS